MRRLGDIGASVQNACIENCSSFACRGLNLLIEASKSDDTTGQQVNSWFNMVLPVILSGLLDGLEVIDSKIVSGLKATKSCTMFLLVVENSLTRSISAAL